MFDAGCAVGPTCDEIRFLLPYAVETLRFVCVQFFFGQCDKFVTRPYLERVPRPSLASITSFYPDHYGIVSMREQQTAVQISDGFRAAFEVYTVAVLSSKRSPCLRCSAQILQRSADCVASVNCACVFFSSLFRFHCLGEDFHI
jgi:hypothetical protein